MGLRSDQREAFREKGFFSLGKPSHPRSSTRSAPSTTGCWRAPRRSASRSARPSTTWRCSSSRA
ncbi:MAG: hypothetical protein ACREI8_06730, partial [Myxococcota bacterium]